MASIEVPSSSTSQTPGFSKPTNPAEGPSRNRIVALLSKIDGVLSRLYIVLSSPSGTDYFLRTATYGLQLIYAGLTRLLSGDFSKVLIRLAMSVSSLKVMQGGGGQAVVAKLPGQAMAIAAAIPRMKALSSLISDFRTFVRLWGLLGMYALGKSLASGRAPADPVLRASAWGQLVVYTVFQALENRAFLAMKGVIKREGKGIMSDYLWSTRMWAIGVALDFVRLARVRQLWAARDRASTAVSEEEKRRRLQEKGKWRRDLIVSLSNAPLTVHWGVEGGILDDVTVGFLGMLGGLIPFLEKWKEAGMTIKAR